MSSDQVDILWKDISLSQPKFERTSMLKREDM